MIIFVAICFWLLLFLVLSLLAVYEYGGDILTAITNRQRAGKAIGWFIVAFLCLALVIGLIIGFLSIYISSCSNCGKMDFSINGVSYCTECGHKYAEDKEKEPPVLLCAYCKEELNDDDKYCGACGAKVVD